MVDRGDRAADRRSRSDRNRARSRSRPRARSRSRRRTDRRKTNPVGSGSGSGSGSGHDDGNHALDGSNSSRRYSRGQHLVESQVAADPAFDTEGGYDSHAASYGNYDAPSRYCKSYGASEHGCYAAESYIGGYNDRPSGVATDPSKTNEGGGSSPARRGQLHSPPRYSNPLLDLEGQARLGGAGSTSRQRRHSSRGKGGGVAVAPAGVPSNYDPRMSQASTTLMGSSTDLPSWGEDISGESVPYPYYNNDVMMEDKSYCATASTYSTASTSKTSGTSATGATAASMAEHEDAIRRGIYDISSLVATYLAGALSFVIGIFLTLLTPFIKIIKLIVGDVRGLLGDMGFLRDVGGLWRTYRDLRRRSGRSSERRPRGGHRGSPEEGNYDRYGGSFRDSSRFYYEDEEQSASINSQYTEPSNQYVGGWAPTVFSTGSNSAEGAGGAPSRGGGAGGGMNKSSRTNSRSYSSLPYYYEDQYQDQHHPPPQHHRPSPGKDAPPMYQDNQHYQQQHPQQHPQNTFYQPVPQPTHSSRRSSSRQSSMGSPHNRTPGGMRTRSCVV